MEEQDKAVETGSGQDDPDTSYEGGEPTRAKAGRAGAPVKDGGKWKSTLKEYAEAIITAIILALVIRAFVVQAFKIPSGSMLETLQIGDHLLVNKFLYGLDLPFTDKKVFTLWGPERGDIVVFKYPEDPRRDFIKRVIAIGGETVEGRNRLIYVDDKPIPEPYVKHTETTTLPGDVS